MASGGNQNPCQFCINSAYKYIISRPVNYLHRELGFFHIDADRILSQNKSDLGTLNLPLDCQQLDLDLNVGFEEWKNPPNVQQHLDSLLFWILCNKEKMTFEDLGLNVDFVTSRGNLARILNVLSGKENKSWTLLATRYRHTIYLSHVEANEGHLSTYGRRILYWGKRFEVAVTKTDSNGKSDCDHGAEKYGPIKAYPGFYSVVRFQLQNHTILLRAEVDAQTQSTNEQPPEYVELKVATETIVHADWAFKQKRLVPWWCQSVVAGTPLIVYGTRDYDGHVKSISAVRTDEIPGIVGLENLDKDKYLLVLSEVLFWIENTVCREDHKVYAIQWDPEAKEMDATARVLPCDDSNKFLRDWYVSEMEAYYASFSAKLREDSRDHGFISHIPPGARFSRTNDQWKGENANKTRKDNSNTDKMALKESWPRGSHDRVWEQAMPEIDDLEIRSEGRYSSERSVTDCQEQVEEARDRKWQTPTEVESIGYDKQSSRNRSPYSPNSRREPLRIDNKRIGKSKQGARQDHPQLQTTKTRNGARSRSYRHSRVSRGLARPAAPPRSPSPYDQKSQEEM